MSVTWFTVLLCFLCTTGYSQSENCTLKKDGEGVRVFTCETSDTRLKSLRAEFTIRNTTLDELLAFLKRVDNYPQWQYNMVSAEIIRRESLDSVTIRSIIDAPWPVANRELIVQYIFKPDPIRNQLLVTTKTTSVDFPTDEDLIRVPFSLAEWIVRKEGNALKVTYTMRIDPGGSVPAWLVNMALAEGPYESFVNLKKQLE